MAVHTNNIDMTHLRGALIDLRCQIDINTKLVLF